MNNITKTFITLVIGVFFGAASGSVLCYFANQANHNVASLQGGVIELGRQSALAAELGGEELKVIKARGIEIYGDDGSLCMQIVASSGSYVGGPRFTEACIYFYGTDGNIAHVLGKLGNKFMIWSEDKDMNRLWGIEEPSTSIFSEKQK